MAIQSAYLTKDDFRTIAMDATTGAVLWDKRYNGPASDFDDPYGIAVAPTAPTCTSPGTAWTRQRASTWPRSRMRRPTGPRALGAPVHRARQRQRHRLGHRLQPEQRTGAVVWQRQYNGSQNADGTARSLAVSADGSRLFVAGTANEAGTAHRWAAAVACDAP